MDGVILNIKSHDEYWMSIANLYISILPSVVGFLNFLRFPFMPGQIFYYQKTEPKRDQIKLL